MTFEDLKKTWQSQQDSFKLTIDSDLLLKELKRDHREFESVIQKRDMGDVRASIFAMLGYGFLTYAVGDWTLFIPVPFILLSLLLFFIVERRFQKRKQIESPQSQTLQCCIEQSLSQLDHQIWLLRNAPWLFLPVLLGLESMAFSMLWQAMRGGCTIVWVWVSLVGAAVFFPCIMFPIYYLNRNCVKKTLLLRKQELEGLLSSIRSAEEQSESSSHSVWN